MKTPLRAKRDGWSDGISVAIFGASNRGLVVSTSQIEVKIVEEGDAGQIQPLAYLDFDDAKRLMDDLWNAGVRPSNDVASTGQLESIKYHLEDMRKLVFEKK